MSAAAPPGPIAWRETRRRLARDRTRIRAMLSARFEGAPGLMLLHAPYVCALLQRLAHYSWRRGWTMAARLFTQANSLLTGADFHPQCDLGGGLLVVHPTGTTCSGNAGEDFSMFPLCGIGMLPRGKDVGAGPGLPLLGDGVWMGAGSGVLGPVVVGSRTRIQPAAVATHDTTPGTLLAIASPPRVASDKRAAPFAPVESRDTSPCGHARWSATREAIAADIERHLGERGVARGGFARDASALLSQELCPVLIHRLSHWLFENGWRRAASLLCAVDFFVFRSTISAASCIGGGAFIPHAAGLVFHGRAGRGITMYARTICAAAKPSPHVERDAGPVIGERAVLAGMAAILGAVTIGDDVRVSFNAQVQEDVGGPCTLASRLRYHAEDPHADPPPTPAPPRHDPPTASLRDLMTEDRRALEALCAPARPGAGARLCTRLFRVSSHMSKRGHHRLAWWCWRLNVGLTGADIDPRSSIAGGLAIPHPVGISLHVSAGRNLTVRALATAGGEVALARDPWAVAARPTIGDGVEICEHASVHGPVRIGDGARIGPGCKLTGDAPAGAWLEVGAPRRVASPPAA